MEAIKFSYNVPGDDFTRAGDASTDLKSKLKKMGVTGAPLRNISISLYEGEINLAIHAGGGEITALVYPDKVELYLPPRSGRRHTLRMIRELLAFEPEGKGTDINGALQETSRLMKKRGVVFLLSDLIAPEEFAASLRLLKAKQDVVAIELSDPADEKFILKNPVTFEDAETGEIVEYSGNIAEINAALNAVQEEKSAVCRRAGVDLIKVDCGGDILKPLIGFFSERQKRIR